MRKQRPQTVKKPSGGVGGAAAPLTFSCKPALPLGVDFVQNQFLTNSGDLWLTICFLEKVASATFSVWGPPANAGGPAALYRISSGGPRGVPARHHKSGPAPSHLSRAALRAPLRRARERLTFRYWSGCRWYPIVLKGRAKACCAAGLRRCPTVCRKERMLQKKPPLKDYARILTGKRTQSALISLDASGA